MTCRPGTPADSFLCRVANISADISATRWPDRHMSVVLTLVLTCRYLTLPAKLIEIEGLGQGSLGYPKGMGFLSCLGNRTDSYVVVFFLAVEKVFLPEKNCFGGS